MNSKFFDISKEKQDRIINGALKIFARNGYEHASTDDMVREAAISKGLLFHYFGSKLGLFEFLYDYSSKFMMFEISVAAKEDETDYFNMMRALESARAGLLRTYPYMRRFMDSMDEEQSAEALAVIEELRETYRSQMQEIYDRLDYSVFGSEEQAKQAVKVVEYSLYGLTKEMTVGEEYHPDALYEAARQLLDYLEQRLVCAAD